MKMSLQEQAEARAALSDFFERLWPGPACAGLEPLCLEELAEMEQRYRRAQRTVEALRHSNSARSGMKQDEELKTPRSPSATNKQKESSHARNTSPA